MISWMLLSVVASWQLLPEPQATWQITFDPTQALVTSHGESILFDGPHIFRYDALGNLQTKGTLSFAPEIVFLDAENRVMIHDGNQILGRINSQNGIVWQRRFKPADLPVFNYKEFITYCVGPKVWLLDTETGWVQYSLERDQDITALAVYKNDLLIADRLGRLLQWNPLTGRRLWLRNIGKETIQYISVSENQELALVSTEGHVEILDGSRRRQWHRQFHIDIAQKPIWYRQERVNQWVLATHGRHLYAFGERGKLLADQLLANRPMLLTRFGEQHALLIAYLSPVMYWYDIEKRVFRTETLPAYQSLVMDQENCLLMVGADGQIRLYQKPLLPVVP